MGPRTRASHQGMTATDHHRHPHHSHPTGQDPAGAPPPASHAAQPPAAGPAADAMTKPDASLRASIFSVFLYGGCSVSMNFVNKATLLSFRLTNMVLLIQMIATLLLMTVLKGTGVVAFPPITGRKCRTLLPVVLLYNANVACALVGLKTLNIAMYSTLKRMTPMIVLTFKSVATRTLPAPEIIGSVLMVVSGCLVAGLGDLSFDSSAYSYAFLSKEDIESLPLTLEAVFVQCGLQASYLLIVEHTGAERDVGSNELLFYNSLLSLPFLLLVTWWTGELGGTPAAFASAVGGSAWFPVLLLVAAYFGCLLNYSQFLCTLSNSALTTTIVGVLKGAVSTVLGFFFLRGGTQFSPMNVAGIAINTAGGVWYTSAKWRMKRAARAAGAGK